MPHHFCNESISGWGKVIVFTILIALWFDRQLDNRCTRTVGNHREICKTWASFQIRKIARRACAGIFGNVFPATLSKWSRHARAMMHVGIANPRWWGKRSWYSRCMRNAQFCVSGKRPVEHRPWGSFFFPKLIITCDLTTMYRRRKRLFNPTKT